MQREAKKRHWFSHIFSELTILLSTCYLVTTSWLALAEPNQEPCLLLARFRGKY